MSIGEYGVVPAAPKVLLCERCRCELTKDVVIINHHVVWNGKSQKITASESRVVSLLFANAGAYVPYRAVYDTVRPDRKGFHAGQGEDGYLQNVRSIIKRLRKKLAVIGYEPNQIENLPTVGYRWKVRQ